MKIKIMTFLLILVVGLSCLGVDSDVAYAYTDADIVSYEHNFDKLSVDSSGTYTRDIFLDIVRPTYKKTSRTVFHSDSPIHHVSLRRYSSDLSTFYSVDFVFSESMIRRSTHMEDGSTHYPGNCYVDKAVFSDGRELYIAEVICQSLGYETVSISYNAEPDYICYVDYVNSELEDSFYKFISTEVYPPKIINYNPDLGYLNNIVMKSLVLTDSVGNQDMSSIKELITFDALSTSGVDLTTGEYSIRVYEQVCYYKGHSSEVFKDDYGLVEIGDFSIDNCSILYSSSDAFNMTTNSTDLLSGWDIFWNNAVRSDNKYYQIIKTNDDGSVEYGGYVKLSCLPDGSGYYATTVTPEHDIDIENGGYIGDDVENGLGSGTNYGDAELDANESLSGNADSVISDVYGVDEFVNTMSNLAGMVGAFPMVLGALFGFLPSWCLGLIASAFALLVALIIYKCVRG